MDRQRNGDPRLPSDRTIRDFARLFKLLSDETRLRILYYLADADELNVRALCDLLHQSQPAVSHHLALLREARLVESRRDGKHNFYRLLPQRLEEATTQLRESAPHGRSRLHLDELVLAGGPVETTAP